MRRTALLGLTFLLAGCQFAGNPFVGFGGFLGDTHTFQSNPNMPPGNDETLRRVRGEDAVVTPLLPEPGDVWPGPVKPIPTMGNMEELNRSLPPPIVPTTPPAPLFRESPRVPESTQTPPTPSQVPTPPPPAADQGGIKTFIAPGGGTGIIVPNGNGTSTKIGPDGSIETIPTPK